MGLGQPEAGEIGLLGAQASVQAGECLVAPLLQTVDLDGEFAGEGVEALSPQEAQDHFLLAVATPAPAPDEGTTVMCVSAMGVGPRLGRVVDRRRYRSRVDLRGLVG